VRTGGRPQVRPRRGSGAGGDAGSDTGTESRIRRAAAVERDAELLRKVRERRLRSVLSAAAGTRAYRKSAGIMRQGAEDTAGHSPWAALSEVPLLGRGRRRPDAADAAVIAHPRAAAAERAAIDRRLFDALGLPPSFTCTVVVPWREPPASGPGLYDPRVRRRRLGLREAEAELAAGGRPGDLLVGTPSVCAELAAAAARAGTEVALASSWDLPRPTRALLGIDHGGPPEAPAELYAVAEMAAPVAVRYPDCPAMHVNADAVHVEVLHPATRRPVPTGTAGLLVLTDLLNTAMPFVRCVVGDVGVLLETGGPCACGRVTPRLLLLGRAAAPDSVTARLTVDAGPRGVVRHLRHVPDELRDRLPDGGLWLSAAERHPLAAWADRVPITTPPTGAPMSEPDAPVQRPVTSIDGRDA
jgi:hypothetical protein